MKLEQQVCSLEQAKRLQKLGILRNSIFHWCEYNGASKVMQPNKYEREMSPDIYFSAFTVAELGVMLPLYYYSYEGDSGREWYCLYDGDESQYEKYEFTNSHTEAEARAKMLIHLLENNLTTTSDCNNRLNS